MKTQITERTEMLICDAMRIIGFDSATDTHQYILEQLYTDEVSDVLAFLIWLKCSKKPFGSANAQNRWGEWVSQLPVREVNPLNSLRNEIINFGKYLKTSYGIAKVFEWKLYSYMGKRYNVSMFNDEIEQVHKIECTVCGRGTYNIKIVFGLHTCPSCKKAIN